VRKASTKRPTADTSHGGDNHLSVIPLSEDTDDELSSSATTTPAAAKRGASSGTPGAAKTPRVARCGLCEKATCGRGKKCPHYAEFH